MPVLCGLAHQSRNPAGGGIRLYRALLPFFMGVLLGDFLIPMGWAVIGLLNGQQMYLSCPH